MSRVDKLLSALGLARASKVVGLEKASIAMHGYAATLESALQSYGATILHDDDDVISNRFEDAVTLVVVGERIRVMENLFEGGLRLIRRPGKKGFICDRNIVMGKTPEAKP